MSLLVAVEESSQGVLEFCVIKSNDEGEIDDNGCLLGNVDNGWWVITFPVIEAGQSRGRIEFSFRK